MMMATWRLTWNDSRQSRVPRWAREPLGILALGIAVACLTGLVVHPRVFVLAGGLLAVSAIGFCWPWVTARGLRGHLAFSTDRTVEGSGVTVTARVANHLPWPAFDLTIPWQDRVVRVPTVAGRTELLCDWPFVPERRGRYPQGPTVVSSAFPFGLTTFAGRLIADGSLVVWPKTYPVGPMPISGGDEQPDGSARRPKAGTFGDVMGVRPYRRGDSPRRIHWAQSAKHDRLVVCELQANPRPSFVLTLDVEPTHHTEGPNGTFEAAVRVAASLAKGWLESGASVGLIAGGTVVPVNGGSGHATKILDALAVVETGSSGTVEKPGRAIEIVITTDRNRSLSSQAKVIALTTAGFGGPAPATCDEAPPRSATVPWLTIDDASELPRKLHGGWSEARHGS
jgi:uncharacterized protein (DUF58 family)